MHTDQPFDDCDLQIDGPDVTITTLRNTGGSVSEVGTPSFGEIRAGSKVYVRARQPDTVGPFRLITGLSVFFTRV